MGSENSKSIKTNVNLESINHSHYALSEAYIKDSLITQKKFINKETKLNCAYKEETNLTNSMIEAERVITTILSKLNEGNLTYKKLKEDLENIEKNINTETTPINNNTGIVIEISKVSNGISNKINNDNNINKNLDNKLSHSNTSTLTNQTNNSEISKLNKIQNKLCIYINEKLLNFNNCINKKNKEISNYKNIDINIINNTSNINNNINYININDLSQEDKQMIAITNTLIPQYQDSFRFLIFLFCITHHNKGKGKELYFLVLKGYKKVTNKTLFKTISKILKYNYLVYMNKIITQITNINISLLDIEDYQDIKKGFNELGLIFNSYILEKKLSFIYNLSIMKISYGKLLLHNNIIEDKVIDYDNVEFTVEMTEIFYLENKNYFNVFDCRRELIKEFEYNKKNFLVEYGDY